MRQGTIKYGASDMGPEDSEGPDEANGARAPLQPANSHDPSRRAATSDPGTSKSKEPNPWMLAGAGLELMTAVAVCTFAGWWLDQKLNSDPWCLVGGAALGFMGGIYNLWKRIRRYL